MMIEDQIFSNSMLRLLLGEKPVLSSDSDRAGNNRMEATREEEKFHLLKVSNENFLMSYHENPGNPDTL
ncbi:hypothetical protein RRG08_046455 [Elysia crispata]|uniref:Uncharacterized protein n=1 Tax=Elysia crispata TaxID=231223 RepID=A0AAE0YIQ9_9GAST|nr:hypothetical protein RRG08_046455 [Elysia crispata]